METVVKDAKTRLRKAIDQEYKSWEGKVFHPHGLDVFVYIKKVEGGKFKCIEINNGAIYESERYYNEGMFSDPSFEATKIQFETRLKSFVKEIKLMIAQ